MRQRVGISLVGEATLSSRIHECVRQDPFRLRAYGGAHSSLRHTKCVDEFVNVGKGRELSSPEIIEAIDEGLLSPDDWVIWGSDSVLFDIAHSPLPLDTRLALLPAKKQEGLEALGSKSGLVTLCRNLPVAFPHSEVVASSADLTQALPHWKGRFLIKANTGAGGTRVRRVDSAEANPPAIPEDWFPVVLQEFVEGPLSSVEALFGDGQLIASVYSVGVRFSSPLGMSTVRHFQPPPAEDFRTSLEILGEKAGLHGFANCSFVWNAQENRHYLFELDMRPNRWHQFGPTLGVSWADAMRSPKTFRGMNPQRQHEAIIHLYPREIEEAIKQGGLSPLAPWLRREPGTWEWRNTKDHSVTRHEWRSIVKVLVTTVCRTILRSFAPRRQPIQLTEILRRGDQSTRKTA